MRFVPLETADQLDLQAIHRVRTRLVARRTAVINQLRGFLLHLSPRFCQLLAQLREEWRLLDQVCLLNTSTRPTLLKFTTSDKIGSAAMISLLISLQAALCGLMRSRAVLHVEVLA